MGDYRRFVLRTVRDGRVRIRGREFVPDEKYLKHDGRLDGHRFAFGLYRGDDSLACLWGTEAYYRDQTVGEDGPHIVDGSYPWLFWHPLPSVTEEGRDGR